MAVHDAALKNSIAKLHFQTGHPLNEHLARAIRLAGGSDAAVQAALGHACPVRPRHAHLRQLLLHFDQLAAQLCGALD